MTSTGARLPLSRSAVDRDATARDRPGLLDDLWADAGTRVLVLCGTRALVTRAEQPRLVLLPPAALPEPRLVVYLGRTTAATPTEPAGTAVVAALVDDQDADAVIAVARDERDGPSGSSDGDPSAPGDAHDVRWGDLRLLGDRLDDRDAGLFTEALAIVNWHRSHGFSPRTGLETVEGRAGWVRHPAGADDEASGEHVFPRTDPAVIVAVTDPADRILLASNVAWPEGRFSLLAGFVEPGESFEAAVEREVLEEAGVRVTGTAYFGSQPWPFPASVMVGFLATADATDPVPDGEEIREARWFTREELSAGAVTLPGRTSIARAIIEHWHGGALPEAPW